LVNESRRAELGFEFGFGTRCMRTAFKSPADLCYFDFCIFLATLSDPQNKIKYPKEKSKKHVCISGVASGFIIAVASKLA